MNTEERLPIFSPLNIASLLFIVIMAYYAIEFNKHGHDNPGISHEEMATGDGESFIKSANEQVPFSFYTIDGLRCFEVGFEDGAVILKTNNRNPNFKSFEPKTKSKARAISSDLYTRYIEYTGITNRNKHTSTVFDAILSGLYPIKVRLYKTNANHEIDETTLLDEMTVTADDYIPLLKEHGVKSKYYPED